jgi:hypothetical protein
MKISGTCRSDDRHAVAAAKTARCIICVTGGRLLLYGHKSKRVVRFRGTIRARTLPIAGDFRNCNQPFPLTRAAQLMLWRTADWAPGARPEPRTAVRQTSSARRYPSRRPSTTKLFKRKETKINPLHPKRERMVST